MEPYTQIATMLQGRLESYLADLQTLVSIDSGPYDKAGANVVNDWLEDHLTKQGFAVRRYA